MINDDFSRYRLKILAESFFAAIAIIIISALLGRQYFSLGYLAGFLVGIAFFSTIYSNIRKLSGLKIKRIKIYLFLRYLMIYTVLGLVLVASLRKDTAMFIGTVFGFLSIKIVIYIDAFLSKGAAVGNK